MRVSLIAAMDRRGLIGDEAGLSWHLPRDLRRFRALTWGKPLILGRTTFELIGKPLPGRFSIVLTRNPEHSAAGCRVAGTFQEALAIAEEYLASAGGDEVMVGGGGKVYAEAIHRWDRCYLTVVEGEFKGSTYFPVGEFLRQPWRPVCDPEICPTDENHLYPHSFHIIERVGDAAHPSLRMEDGGLARAGADPTKALDGLDLAAIMRRGTTAS